MEPESIYEEDMIEPDSISLTEEERAYRKHIDRCALEALDLPIKNSRASHACYLMTKMFSLASKHVYLYTGKLVRRVGDDDVYASKELLAAVRSFLKRSGNPKLQIVVQGEVDGGTADHPLVLEVEKLFNEEELKGRLEIRKAADGSADISSHFMVMDMSAYRIELEPEPSCAAVANFGDAKCAKMVGKYFETNLFPSAESIYKIEAA